MSRISKLNLITSNISEHKGLYIVEPIEDLIFLTDDNIDEYVNGLYKKEKTLSIIRNKNRSEFNMTFSYDRQQALCIV